MGKGWRFRLDAGIRLIILSTDSEVFTLPAARVYRLCFPQVIGYKLFHS